MSTRKLLTNAKALIADENRWTVGVHARNEDGDEVDPWSHAACSRCAEGALAAASGLSSWEDTSINIPYLEASLHIRSVIRDEWADDANIADINDHDGHTEVMKMFDMAIESSPN